MCSGKDYRLGARDTTSYHDPELPHPDLLERKGESHSFVPLVDSWRM